MILGSPMAYTLYNDFSAATMLCFTPEGSYMLNQQAGAATSTEAFCTYWAQGNIESCVRVI